MRGRSWAALGTLCVFAGMPMTASAQSGDFYAGKTVTISVAAGEGGGYSLYAQLAAEYLRKHLPGHPTVLVQNMPGAGGLRAADYLYNVAPKDGTALAALLDLVAVTQMLRPKQVKYDIAKFSMIGSLVTDNPVLMVRDDAGIQTFADMKSKEVVIGSSGPGSQTYINPVLVKDVLGAKVKIVTGYRGASDISLALDRNEVQAQFATWVSWKARKADWIKEKKILPLMQVGLKKEPELPDVPLMMDLASSDEDRQVLEFMSSGSQVGRFLAAPPGVPAERLAVLRKAFDDMMHDEEFRKIAEQRRLDIVYTSGAEVQAIIQKVVSFSPAVIKRAQDVTGVKD